MPKADGLSIKLHYRAYKNNRIARDLRNNYTLPSCITRPIVAACLQESSNRQLSQRSLNGRSKVGSRIRQAA